jgi:hypothetical protein
MHVVPARAAGVAFIVLVAPEWSNAVSSVCANDPLDQLGQCLVVHQPDSAGAMHEVIQRATASGAVPFEVIAGTPHTRYGARLTFRPVDDPRPLAAAFGLEDHPWGLPAWVGVRVYADGTVRAKAYHRLERLDGRFELPVSLPPGLHPVMASLYEGAIELYLFQRLASTWSAFVTACTALVNAPAATFMPYPSPAESGYGLTLCWHGRQVTAMTLLADERCLPDDAAVRRAWSQGMDDVERSAYESALAGVRSLGRRGRHAWHALLGWTFGQGSWHRAASLRVPPTARSLACSS